MILAIKEDYDMNTEFGVRPTSMLSLPPAFVPSPSIPESSRMMVARNIALNLAAHVEPTKSQQDSSKDCSRDGIIKDGNLEWIGVADWNNDYTTGTTFLDEAEMTASYRDEKLLHDSSLNPCNEQLDTTIKETKSKSYVEDFVLVDIQGDDDIYGSDGDVQNTCSDSLANSPTNNLPVQRDHNGMVGHVWTLPTKNPAEESSRAALSRSLLLLVSLVRNAVLR